MSYRDDVPRGDGIDRFPGVSFTNGGTPHSVFLTGGERGDTVFRAVPEMQNGAEVPFRLGEGDYNYSYWMKAKRIIRKCGVKDKFSCITEVKGKARDYQGPIDKFVNTIYRAANDVKNGKVAPTSIPAEWLQWVARQGAVPRTEMAGMLQGYIFRTGKTVFKDQATQQLKPKSPALLIFPKTAREVLEDKCNKEVEKYAGKPDDWASRYSCGDFLSLANGKLLQFVFVPGGQGQGSFAAHYVVNVLPQTFPITPAEANRVFMPWEQLLRLHTEKEQMDLLVAHFPPESLDYVFGHDAAMSAFLPESVKGSWYRRATVAPVPMQPSTQAPAPQQYAPAAPPWMQPPQPQTGVYTPPATTGTYTPPVAMGVPGPAVGGGSLNFELPPAPEEAQDSAAPWVTGVSSPTVGGQFPTGTQAPPAPTAQPTVTNVIGSTEDRTAQARRVLEEAQARFRSAQAAK